LREDATFHTFQNVEAGFRQFSLADTDRERLFDGEAIHEDIEE
jgi:hypothetical protein